MHNSSILCATYSGELDCIITGGDDCRITVHYMDGHVPMDGDTLLPTLFDSHLSRVTGVTVMMDGILASVSHDKTIRTWNLIKMKPLQVVDQLWLKNTTHFLYKN